MQRKPGTSLLSHLYTRLSRYVKERGWAKDHCDRSRSLWSTGGIWSKPLRPKQLTRCSQPETLRSGLLNRAECQSPELWNVHGRGHLFSVWDLPITIPIRRSSCHQQGRLTPFHQDFISAAHLVYHDVLAELLSTESWGVRPNDAGSANGPDNLQTLQTCACFLWPMSLGANSHTQATGNGRAKQLFLKTSWFLSVLLNGVLHGSAAPQFACFREAI